MTSARRLGHAVSGSRHGPDGSCPGASLSSSGDACITRLPSSRAWLVGAPGTRARMLLPAAQTSTRLWWLRPLAQRSDARRRDLWHGVSRVDPACAGLLTWRRASQPLVLPRALSRASDHAGHGLKETWVLPIAPLDPLMPRWTRRDEAYLAYLDRPARPHGPCASPRAVLPHLCAASGTLPATRLRRQRVRRWHPCLRIETIIDYF
jgi:hypothetical protein